MTTFVVSLFLPYTIDFKDTKQSTDEIKNPDPIQTLDTRLKASLVFDPLKNVPGVLNDTPPLSPNLNPFDFLPKPDPSSKAIHLAKPHDTRTLAHSDAHVPEWGRIRSFNQPLSPSPQSASLFSELPWVVEPSIQGNGGLRNAVNAASSRGILDHKLWVGTIGFPTDALEDSTKNDVKDVLESVHDALTVITDDDDFDGHYRHFCKTILWPVLHYQIPDHPKSKAYEDHSWIYYVKVNEKFAERVIENYKHGDVIWIHDYHLMLVPTMVRKKLSEARIGFFLHVAFPSSEVFRCLAFRRELLEGMLGANLVAFQTKEYAQHFLQTCSRLLLAEATEHGVQLDTHFVDVQHIPIGVVPDDIEAARQDDEVLHWIRTIERKYHGKQLIVSRDQLDNVRGVKQKLLAFELFLEENPSHRENTLLFQVITAAGTSESIIDKSVSDIATRVNSRYSSLTHQPLVILKQDIAFSQYLALLSVADVLMITSLREGMNLTCQDYIVCQKEKHGPLILSEFTGSAVLFRGGEMSVNPWDRKKISHTIWRALRMSDIEKETRHGYLMNIISSHDGTSWIQELNWRLESAYEDHLTRDTMSIPRLPISETCEQYKQSSCRYFILDYEGSMALWGPPGRSVSTSPQRTISVILELMADADHNTVYVTSARTPAELEHLFRQVPDLGLIAENGCFVRPFGSHEWIDISNVSQSRAVWKPGVLEMLVYYRDRIEGSWIEERNRSMVFHYENTPEADLEAAERQAGHAAEHINENCLAERMRAVPLEKCVVIEPCDTNKETASQWVLDHLCRQTRSFVSILESACQSMDNPDSTKEDASRGSFSGGAISESEVESPILPSQDHLDEAFSPELSPRLNNLPPSRTHRRSTGSSRRSSAHTRPYTSLRNISRNGRLRGISNLDHDSMASDSGPKCPVDFLFVAGDDRDDEPVFRWANALGVASAEGANCGIKNVISVCVGKRNTDASFTLTQGVTGLLSALQKLANA